MCNRDLAPTGDDLARYCDDVGASPGAAYACLIAYGDGITPSQICALLGPSYNPATSATGIDLAKLSTLQGFYLAAAYGTFNAASQQVTCSIRFGEQSIFGGGGLMPRGVRRAQPAPCFGFSLFYGCDSGDTRCGAGPDLETTVVAGAGWGVLCSTK